MWPVSLNFAGTGFFLGANGQGETNLLEAIGLAGNLRSFRKSGMDGLVRDGQIRSQTYYRFLDDYGDEREVFISFLSRKKILEVDGVHVYVLVNIWETSYGNIEFKRFSPYSRWSADRRRWLDLLLSSSSTIYFRHLQAYSFFARANALLRNKQAKESCWHSRNPWQTRLKFECVQTLPAISKSMEKSFVPLPMKRSSHA